jgi:hypothetical protein
VPRSAVTMYDTIRRTIDRQSNRPRNTSDQYAVQQSRSRGSRGQNVSVTSPNAANVRSQISSQITSRASRNRDRARAQRQSRSDMANGRTGGNGEVFRNVSDRQRLLQQNRSSHNNSRTETTDLAVGNVSTNFNEGKKLLIL